MAKKGTKKGKKKAPKKAAKRTSAKKTSTKKKSGTKPAARGRLPMVFNCVDGACVASTGRKTHLKKAKTRWRLIAGSSGNVTIEFIDPDTNAQITPPFQDTTNPIHIAAGTHKDEVVRAGAAGEFFYNLTCQNCGTVVEPPEMIVP